MMLIRTVMFISLLCGFMLPVAQAETAKERLLSFFKDVHSMQAQFTQIVKSQGFADKDTSKGMFRLLRPGRFRWDYEQPYKQEIIADGDKLWIYDMDMDQVIVKPLDLVLGQTPAVLLSGSASLTDRFEIEDMPERHDLDLAWVLLRPKDKDTSYEKLMLGFDKQDVKAMELVDNFGQVTLLQFSKLQRNPKIDPKVFQFQPPPGVDVIGDEEVKP